MARHDDPKIVDIFWKQIIANGTYQFINFTLIIKNFFSLDKKHLNYYILYI